MVMLADLIFFRVILSSADQDQRWTKITLKSKAAQEEELSKETHKQTPKATEDTQKHRNNSARKANERYYSGLYSSKFHPKASNSKDEEHPSLITLTRQDSLFGILQKIRKTETNTSFLNKKERGWGGRGEERC